MRGINSQKKYFIILKKLTLILLFLSAFTFVKSQDNMFIGQIEGRTIVRENFSSKGLFLNKQIFDAGKIMQKNGNYEIKITTELFDKNKKSIEKYETIYKCKPDKFSVVVFVFPFANPKFKETEISTKSTNFRDLYNLNKLDDIDLDLSFDSGLMNFFGSKSSMRIYDRKKSLKNNNTIIMSKIIVKAYTFGIKIKQLNYNIVEMLNNNGRLTYQKFTENDGSYFTLNYK